jgi:transmembrane protein 231
MVLYQVYSQEYRIRYFAHPISTAVVFQIACILLTFLAPLFTGYFTSGFYLKELTYTEQPQVSFLGQYTLFIDSLSSFIFSSSDARLNNYFTSTYYPSTITTDIPQDVNGDGIVDQQTISINVILPQLISGSSINLWLIYQYALNQYPLVNMQTLGIISLQAPSSLSNNRLFKCFSSSRSNY